MPYITPALRPPIDKTVDALAEVLFKQDKPTDELAISGQINYAITRLLVRYLLRYGKSYSAIALLTGILTNVKDELYRRIASEYEDRKKLANGDVYRELL